MIAARTAIVAVSAACLAWSVTAEQLPPRDVARAAGEAAVVRGTVTAADTGLPIRNAEIVLAAGAAENGRMRSTVTDEDGRYEFAALPVGAYTVSVRKTGYVHLVYGQTRAWQRGRVVHLTGPQSVGNVNIALPRGGVVVVRLTDGFGDPLSGYRVVGYQHRIVEGRRRLTEAAGDRMHHTDDRGEIRLSGLWPGEYYIGAIPVLTAATGSSLARTRAPQTFFPGTASELDAQPVTVGIGEEVTAAFQIAEPRLSRIRGVIAGVGNAPNVMMMRYTLGTEDRHPITVAEDRTFSAANMPPGEYVISAYGESESGMLRVWVSGEDVDGLVLAMKPPARLRGRLTLDSGSPGRPPLTNVVLRPAFSEDFGLINPPMTVAADGTFEMTDVTGTGMLRLHYASAGLFLKAVLLDGTDVTNVPLAFSAYEGRGLEVQLTARPTEIAGSVIEDRKPSLDYVAIVYPEDPALWTRRTTRIAVGRPDQQGRFAIRGVPPGRYLAAAVDQLAPDEEQYPETLERLRRTSTALTLEDGQSRYVELVLNR